MSFTFTSVIAALRLPRPDVIYASSPHLLAALAGWAISRLRGAPLVVEVRDLWPQVLVEMNQISPQSYLYRALQLLETFLYNQASRVVVLAAGAKTELVHTGVPEPRVVLIPNGSDPEAFVGVTNRSQVRQRLGVDGFLVGYTGAHGPANGLNFLLDAAAEIQATHPHVHFLLVGSGPEKQALVDRSVKLGLQNVTFHDPVPKSEIPAILKALDVGVHVLADLDLFKFAVSPNKLLDYMAAGLPVVTNAGGEVGDLVATTGAGLAVASDEIARGVAILAGQPPEALREIGCRGQAYLRGNRSLDRLAEKLEFLLDEVLCGKIEAAR